MVKILMGLGFLVMLMSMAALATFPEGQPEPLGPNDYVPPLSESRLYQMGLEDPRPDEDRTCELTATRMESVGCQLRGAVFTCYDAAGVWSRDLHTWKFDGHACRYSVQTRDIEPPREASR